MFRVPGMVGFPIVTVPVALMFGSGILGLGHHYFWIGTPDYWFEIGGFFSALEPIPLVAMVVHAVFDAGVHKLKATNHPTLAWTIAQAFGNFFGAYVTTNIAFFYLAAQKWRGNVWMSGDIAGSWKWKWSMVLLSVGMIGMTMAMLIAGYEQSQIERAIDGSTWAGYFAAQAHPWFRESMWWREICGWMFAAGYVLLVWDLLTIGSREKRTALVHDELAMAT